MTCGRIIDLNIYLILNLEQEQSCRERPAPLPSILYCLLNFLLRHPGPGAESAAISPWCSGRTIPAPRLQCQKTNKDTKK